jgi:hypothetical protein
VKPGGVKVTLYLPDEIRIRAREAGLNLSALLRAAIERELRGEGPEETVEAYRVGDRVEIRVSIPAEALRDRLG